MRTILQIFKQAAQLCNKYELSGYGPLPVFYVTSEELEALQKEFGKDFNSIYNMPIKVPERIFK